MSERKSRKTWQHPWSYREEAIVTIAMIVVGFASQWLTGNLHFISQGFIITV